MIYANDWVNMTLWTGRSEYRLRTSLRERGDVMSHCSSITAAVGDPACNPGSAGMAGPVHLAPFYGVGEQQFRRNILPYLPYIRWLEDIPVTNQASAFAHGAIYQALPREAKRDWLMTNCSSGYT